MEIIRLDNPEEDSKAINTVLVNSEQAKMYFMINELKCFFQCPHIVLIIRKIFAISCSPALFQRIMRKDRIFFLGLFI